MKIGNVTIWLSAKKARALGATHHARIHGLIPGFLNEDATELLWMPRSDFLYPLEDLLNFISDTVAAVSGQEPHYSFDIGKPIEPEQTTDEDNRND